MFSQSPFFFNNIHNSNILTKSNNVFYYKNLNPTEKIKIPEEFKAVFIKVNGASKNIYLSHFSSSLNVTIFENYGNLKVNYENGKSASKIYIKVYSKDVNENIKFHKDGYTDLLGRFDYASVSQIGLENLRKFSILIFTQDLGNN